MGIKLELLNESEFGIIVNWINNYDEDFLVQWSGLTYKFPLSTEQMLTHYLRGINSQESDVYIYKIIDQQTNEMIGSLQICRFDASNNEAVVGRFIIGEERYRASGIGTSALKALLKIGFTQFNLNRIKLNVYDTNQPAIRCYERLGFKKGRLTENVYTSSHGHQWSNWEMYLDKDIWESEENVV
ncbi:GNAT family N-acetyltransferase [Paenibacillus xanthanilyticus]|uniref:GNAT family N-acetyltransferase n=1 Tax=Paenibacillus xanthanilyticus TaxID=1783531 RepID=A0ABV8K0Y0_9BACL